MKKIVLLLTLFMALTAARAQQIAPLDHTREKQVITNRAEHVLYFWLPPSGAAPNFPAYVPDSLKCGALYNSTGSTAWELVGGGTAANPTATAGLNAVNRTSLNFMRADASPKVDSTIFKTKASALADYNNITTTLTGFYGNLGLGNIWTGQNHFSSFISPDQGKIATNSGLSGTVFMGGGRPRWTPADYSSLSGNINFTRPGDGGSSYASIYLYLTGHGGQNVAFSALGDFAWLTNGGTENLRLNQNGNLDGNIDHSANYTNTSYVQKAWVTAQVAAFSPPTGPAGGDLSGTYPNPTVSQFNNQLPSYYLDRANHTGTQAESTVTNLVTDLAGKQDTLVSGTNIKTVNSQSLVGSGNLAITTANTDTTSTGFMPKANSLTLAQAQTKLNSYTYVVTTITTLQAYTGPQTTVAVSATDGTGGVFIYSTSSLTADGGVIVTATGKGSGYWVRQFNPGDGVRVAWWGDNDAGIDNAITYAGVYGKVVFTTSKTYPQAKLHTPLAGQVWIGNNATLQRQTETSTTTSGTVLSSATSFTVSTVPGTWHVNDYVQIYTSQNASGASNVVQIQGISGTTITLYSAIGVALYNAATSYASGSGIYKVWDQVYDNATHVSFEVNNLNFDGNSSTSAVNVYWGANHAINGSAPAIRIINCNFINMGNDCIDGHGLYVTGCTYKNLNNSFIHLSTDFSLSPATYPSEIFANRGFNSNQIASATGSHHSQGVITLSFTAGYCNIYDNWFSGGLDAALGTISMGASSTNGGTRYMRFHHNQCFNLGGIISDLSADVTETTKPGVILIDGNVFSNCGTTAPFPTTLNANWTYYDKITFTNNDLSDGTTITIPAEVYSTSTIANTSGTANIQTGTAIDIDGNITNGGNNSTGGTSSLTGNVNIGGATNSTESLGIHKNITGGTAAYGIFQDGAIQSGVTSSTKMIYSKPSTQDTSFTLGGLYHLFLGGVTIGSGSAVTNQYGVYVQSTFNTATNNYGIYGNLVKASGSWFLYNASTADSYSAGNYGIHQSTITAYLHLGAGSSSASSAPLKFTSGTNLTSAEAGAVEYNGTDLFYTTSTPTRRTIANLDAVQTLTNKIIGTGTVYNSTLATVNATATLTAAQMQTGFATTSTTAVTATTATATATATQVGATGSGFSYEFTVDNHASSSAGAVTVALGTGWTATSAVTGGTNLVVAIGTVAVFKVVFTSATSIQVGRIM